MRRFRAFAVLLILLAGYGTAGYAADYGADFIGVNAEADLYVDSGVTLDRLGLVFTYGPSLLQWDPFETETNFFPIRVRGGLGYAPGRPFAVTIGTEVALIEILNRARAKFFGLYLITDLALELYPSFQPEFIGSLSALVPLGSVGGLSIGGGLNHRGRPVIKAGLMTGVFPLQSSRQSRE